MSAAAAPMDDAALNVEAITKSFPAGGQRVQALREASLRVRKGCVTGLIGPDGAGKTTLMRLAAGLLVPDAGRIVVLGLDAAKQSLAVQSSLGYMPQRFGLYEDLSVQENLDLYADLQGVPPQERPPRYAELMHMTGLGPFRQRLAGRLSGGMKQKLGLACTLVRRPELLLLDEPTVGVDPVSRRELWSIVYRLVREEGMSVLLSTAYLDEAERCDEVVMLHEGRVLGQAPPDAFSRELEGHSFLARADIKKRVLQDRLAEEPAVLDAVIQRNGVRIVFATAPEGDPRRALGGLPFDVSIEPLPPRFEDAFIARLSSSQPLEPIGVAVHKEPPSHSDKPVIAVQDLQRRFGDFYAVNNVTFDVLPGEVFGLLGANGAGKSTTFRMLCGLLPPSGGHLQVAGVDLRHAAAQARARIGYMSQKFALYGNLSVRQNLDFFGRSYNLTGARQAERRDWALMHFQLEEYADVNSADLPLGYKQRLALAAALMHEPRILFLDEPTSGVDPLARREFWRRINALAEQGVTVLVTTHFMEEAEYCDRLAIMVAGEILTLGTPDEVKAQARTAELPEPSMEDAFIHLIQSGQQAA